MNALMVDLAGQAQAAFTVEDFKEAYRLALEGLGGGDEHADLLAIAGRAALELGLDEAGPL